MRRQPSSVQPKEGFSYGRSNSTAANNPASTAWAAFSDLAAILEIIKGQSYPAVVLLLTGVLLLVLHAKNGDNVKASLDDLKEFAAARAGESAAHAQDDATGKAIEKLERKIDLAHLVGLRRSVDSRFHPDHKDLAHRCLDRDIRGTTNRTKLKAFWQHGTRYGKISILGDGGSGGGPQAPRLERKSPPRKTRSLQSPTVQAEPSEGAPE